MRTGQELVAAVAAALPGERTVVKLATDFETLSARAALAIPAGADVVVESAGSSPTRVRVGGAFGHLVVNGAAGSSLTLQDLRFEGRNDVASNGSVSGSAAGGGVSVTGTGSGTKLTVDDTQFEGIADNSALFLGSGVAKVAITDTSFRGNSNVTGAAIWAENTTGPLSISDATFQANSGTGVNYPGGAIYVKYGSYPLTIERSVFVDNSSISRGGALGIDYQTGTTTVRDCVFDSNTNNQSLAGAGTGNGTRVDGGAIGYTTASDGPGTLAIEGTTFVKNSAYDEGGAIEIEAPNGKATITNSTFVGNTAAGRQVGDSTTGAGGAIEFYSGTITLVHNTFYDNEGLVGAAAGVQRGGAFSTSSAALILRYNLVLGNVVRTADGSADAGNSRANVSAAAITLGSGNVGVDNGAALPTSQSVQAAYGTNAPKLVDGGSKKVAGDPRWSKGDLFRTPQTLSILFADRPVVDGIAADLGADSDAVKDARGQTRDADHGDSGAVTTSWLRFDANGGHWSDALTDYDGERLDIVDSDGVTIRYLVAPAGSQATAPGAPDVAPASSRFVNWAGDTTLSAGASVDVLAGGATYSASWVATSTVTVKYQDMNGNTVHPDVVLTGTIGEEYVANQFGVSGYVVSTTPANATGEFTSEPQTVIFRYQPSVVQGVSAGSVTVRFVTADGTKVSDDLVLTGNVGENYATTSKQISGYTLVSVPGNASGLFVSEEQTVTYVYRLTSAIAGSDDTVNDGGGKQTGDEQLARTGVELAGWLGASIGLVAGGLVLIGAIRRRPRAL